MWRSSGGQAPPRACTCGRGRVGDGVRHTNEVIGEAGGTGHAVSGVVYK